MVARTVTITTRIRITEPSDFIVDRKRPIADQICEKLRNEIVSIRFAPGSLLSETDLASWLGVSRTPVREAVKRLVGEGFVESIPQLGTYVSLFRESRIAEAQFLREELESALTRRAARRITSEAVVTMNAILEMQDIAVTEKSLTRFHALDHEFHRFICLQAGLPGVWETVRVAAAHLSRLRHLSLPIPYVPDEAASQHREIGAALADKDPDASEAAMRRHLRNIFKVLPEIRTANADYFAPGDALVPEEPSA